MAVTFKTQNGQIIRENTEAYICDRFLDLVEEKPFYRIKVRELTEHANISRSTFYVYFDSVYSVVQKLEDDFIKSFYPEAVAFSVLIKNDISKTLEQIAYIKSNARALRLLCGPNGDSYFMDRLERIIKHLCDKTFEEIGADLTVEQRSFLGAYITGGTLYITKKIAERGESLSNQDLKKLSSTIMHANNILFGMRK
jgi:AcrR family transcriptional regulator